MTFSPSPEIIATPLSDDELVLLHLTTHNYYSLNETGQFIWKQLVAGQPPEAVVDAILDRWEADRSDVEAYVANLIDDLQSESLLIPAAASTE